MMLCDYDVRAVAVAVGVLFCVLGLITIYSYYQGRIAYRYRALYKGVLRYMCCVLCVFWLLVLARCWLYAYACHKYILRISILCVRHTHT